jgi:hypothetical protein
MATKTFGDDLDTTKYSAAQWEEMKGKFPNVDDRTLARFLIARNGDVSKSAPLLQGHLDWKEQNWPILKEECLKEFSVGRCYVNGFDKEGHPIIVFHTRLHNPSDRDLEELGRMVIYIFECAIKRLPPHLNKVTVMINRTGAGSNADIEFMRHFTNIMQNNYPERLYRTIVYPSGFIFYGIWSLVSVFLDPVTRDKVKPVMYLSGVQEFVEDQYIPSEMGGKSTYTFNPADFEDPYPEEAIVVKKNKLNGVATAVATPVATTDDAIQKA